MSNIGRSESQRVLIEGLDFGRLLDRLPLPVVLLAANGTIWLNAAAGELDDWLKVDDAARSLIAELGPALQSVQGASENPAYAIVTLRQNAGALRRYRAALIEAASPTCDAVVLAGVAGDNDAAVDAAAEIAHARLEDVQRQLLQADRMSTIGQLAAGVAHEINNPIGYVQSNLDTLREYTANLLRLIGAQDAALRQLGPTDAGVMHQVTKVRQEIDFDFLATDLPTMIAESRDGIARVRKIIQDLRDFSRAGTSETWTFADIHSGLDSTINIVWNDLKYKVELVKHYGDLPPIECLPSQLNQVLMNMLVNAGQAIEGHGQITIVTRTQGDFVLIEISDTGQGIAAEHLPRVFEPFFTTKPVGKGTGLGLSISYGIVRKHHGEIDVRSEPGVGTTFIIKLPVRQQHAHEDAASATA